jgi:hypothetical protein
MSGDIVETIKRELAANRMELKTLLGSDVSMDTDPKYQIPAPFLSVEEQYVEIIGKTQQEPNASTSAYTIGLFDHWKIPDRMSYLRHTPAEIVRFTDPEFSSALSLLLDSATTMDQVRAFLYPRAYLKEGFYNRPTDEQRNSSIPTVTLIAKRIYQTNETIRKLSAMNLDHRQ